MSAFSHDPATYRKLAATPFASADEANAALTKFYEDVYDARIRAGIPDVQIVARLSILDEDGASGDSFSRYGIGDEMFALPLLAYAFGMEQAQTEQRTIAMMAKGKKRGSKKADA